MTVLQPRDFRLLVRKEKIRPSILWRLEIILRPSFICEDDVMRAIHQQCWNGHGVYSNLFSDDPRSRLKS